MENPHWTNLIEAGESGQVSLSSAMNMYYRKKPLTSDGYDRSKRKRAEREPAVKKSKKKAAMPASLSSDNSGSSDNDEGKAPASSKKTKMTKKMMTKNNDKKAESGTCTNGQKMRGSTPPRLRLEVSDDDDDDAGGGTWKGSAVDPKVFLADKAGLPSEGSEGLSAPSGPRGGAIEPLSAVLRAQGWKAYRAIQGGSKTTAAKLRNLQNAWKKMSDEAMKEYVLCILCILCFSLSVVIHADTQPNTHINTNPYPNRYVAYFDPDVHATGKNAFKLTDVKWEDVRTLSFKMKYRHHLKNQGYETDAIARKWSDMKENQKRRWFLEHVLMAKAGEQAAISDDDEPTGSDVVDVVQKRERTKAADTIKAREEKNKESATKKAEVKAVGQRQQGEKDDDYGVDGHNDYNSDHGDVSPDCAGQFPVADDDDDEIVVDESRFIAWLKGWRADEAKKLLAAANTKGKGKSGKSMKPQSDVELRELFISMLKFEPRPSKQGGSKAARRKMVAATKAKAKDKRSLAETRTTAQSISFEDGNDNGTDMNGDEDEDEGPALSQMSLGSKRLKRPSPAQKKQFAPLKEEKTAAAAAADGSAIARPKKRRPWTAEEECALIGGVSRYGQSMWTSILSCAEFGPVLRGRSNVNLKDKYRNMCKSGDLIAL
jgi:hypothetical protein